MNRFRLIHILILIHLVGFSQKGKNGAGNISVSTVVNAYTSLTADAFTGNTTINVASGAGYAIGDLIYIIQMQGANTNCFINPFGNPNSAEPYTPAFGRITNYNNAGNNEYAQVSSVAGNVITIDCPLKNNYTAAGKVQVVKVPRYTSLTITATGIITCSAWNGTTGGVIAIEVDGNTTINAGGKIDASALGFRGGVVIGKLVSSVFGGGSYANNNVNEGGYKGEGIAGSVADYLANFNGPYCKGAVANAGGGGNGNNAGGGGGANAGDTSLYLGTGNPDISVAGYVTAWNLEVAGFAGTNSSGGGRGGYSFANTNLNPRISAPGSVGWTGDNRRVAGGLGGRPLNYNTGRLFSGGGGGAADENDAYGGAGGNGGGIINIISYGTVTGAGQILSNGQNGFNTLTPTPGFFVSGRDGAGGAGGGGAIVINSIGLINALTVSANGGNGGNQQMKNGGSVTGTAYGPGGGGGGGYIGTTAAAITTAVNGGVNGTVQYLSGLENCQIDIVPATNSFPANGSTIGGSGVVTSTLQTIPTITASPDVTICINNSTILTATTTGPPSTISWYTNFAGITLLGTGSAFTTSVFTTVGTYTIWAGFCPSGTYRDPVIITVTNGPTLTATSQTICSGQTATLVASGATTYTWNTGINSATINPTPAATTIYTVIGASGTCSTQTTATVTVNSGGAITINSPTICSGQTATLVASGATTYTWNTGSNSATINPSPAATTVYTVNGSIGVGCNLTNTTTVFVVSTPTLSVNSATICTGQTATLTANGATTYTWNTGSNSATINPSPVATTIYTVTGSNGSCSVSATASVTVGSIALASTSQTICSGQTATLVASGATTYTWNTGSNSATINPAPLATTVYTVIGASGTCSASTTATVTVNSGGTITINSPTICSGQTATLVASGATTYTWNTGSNSATINPAPLATSVYTVIGNNGTCTTSATATVTVGSITLTATSQTICTGFTATLVANGASTYTWNTGSNSATINPAPIATTVYTLIGASGTCSTQTTATVTVNSGGAITINSPTICSGQTATLVASGATTYTWNTGSNSATINPVPVATTIYTVIGASGTCSTQTTATVTVNSGGTITVNSPTICSGQTATLVASGATTYTWNTGSNSATINPAPIATSVYTIIGSNGSCSTSATATVTVGSITLTATSQTICAGLTATLVANGATTYTWNTGSNSATINPSPATTTTYTVIGANGTCSASTTATVTINASGAISVNNATICSGQTATLSAGAAASYTWNTGQNTQNIVVNPITTTVYTINATLGAGCNASNTATVIVNTNPTITVNNASICAGQTATLNTVGAISYVWYDGSTAASNTVSPITTTSYSVVGSSNGCTNSATANVVVTPNPTVSATSVSICAGQTASLTGIGATTYTWDPSGANTVGATFTASPVGTTVYNLLGATNGCVSSATVSVSVGSNLSVSVNNATICSGQSASLIANSTATNYSWNTGATTSSIIVNPITNTTYTVNGNSAGCTGSTTATVFVNTTPIIPNFNQAICVGETTTLTASGATSYSWNTGSTATVIIVSPTITTTYTLIGANGTCTTSANYNVMVNSLPTVTTNSATICNGASTTLTASGATSYTWIPLGTISNTISVNPASNTNYTVIGSIGSCTNLATANVIVTNGGTVAVTGATVCNGQNAVIGTSAVGSTYLWDNGATTQSITVSPNTTTSYSVQVTSGGCTLTGSTTVGISSAPLINAIGASICTGQTATLIASGASNYTWTPGNFIGNNIMVNPTTSTSYMVSSYNNGCISTATALVQVNTKPSLTLTPTNVLVCPNTPITFIATGATNYDWYVDGNYQFGNPLIISPSKTSIISVIGSNGGCTASLTTTAYVSTISAAFNAESNYVDYPGSLSFTNTSAGYNSIYWDFGNGQTSTTNNNNAFYELPGKYLVTLLARDTLGCSDTAYYVIEAGCGNGDIFIPNTFTPNQDGLNETFRIYGGTCLTKFSGTIFDRWGHELFKFKNITDVWDGKVKGVDVEIGTYNYLINYTLYNGKQFSKTGVITVER